MKSTNGFSIGLLSGLTAGLLSAVAFAQTTAKPGRPLPSPVLPVKEHPMIVEHMEPFTNMVGTWVATSSAGASDNVECSLVADGAWLACQTRGAVTLSLVLGWDKSAHGYRGFVGTASSAAHVYKGTLAGHTLTLEAPGSPSVTMNLVGKPITVTVGQEHWALHKTSP